MPTHTEINYDPAKVRFLVSCPTWDIGKGQQFPKRKWDKENRRWEFPVSIYTVQLLNEAWPDATWSKNAERVGRKTLEAKTSLIPANRTPFPANYRFKRKPMPHQKFALDYTYSIDRAALFCEMRTGKTKVSIDDAVQKAIEKKVQRVLIFAPNNALFIWQDSIKADVAIKHSVHALRLSHYREAEEFLTRGCNSEELAFGVVAYESFSSNSTRAYDWAHRFIDHRPTALICDESHWLKNGKAQRTKRIMEIAKRTIRRRILTGTEITKDLEDLYSQFQILGDILPMDSFFAFRNRYCVMGGYESREIAGYKNTKELFDAIRPFTFQIKRKDVEKDLPDKIPQKILVEMTEEQEKIYKIIKKATLTSDGREMNALTRALRLHQIAGGFTSEGSPQFDDGKGGKSYGPVERWISDVKINELVEFLEPIEGQVVIWARYKIEIEKIVKALGGEAYVLTGDTPREERQRMVKAFQRGEGRFVVGNTQTGGVAIDLSAADTVVFYSSSYNYAEQVQAEDRVQALNRKKAVLYAYFICADTIDETIMEAIEAKMDLAEYLKSEIRRK